MIRVQSRLSLWLYMIPGIAGFSRHHHRHSKWLCNHKAAPTGSRCRMTTTQPFLDVYGGDFAGHSATFSSQTGALIRVPEHLLPRSMIEWDSIPSAFEILTSEDYDENRNKLRRNIITVIPEVGCGVDNLDVLTSSEDLDMKLCHKGDDSSPPVVACVQQVNQKRFYETTFSTTLETTLHRTRVSFEINQDSTDITSPIRIAVERQTRTESSKGTIAQGGGLDGRTVASLIGKDLYNKIFADRPALINMDSVHKHLPPDLLIEKPTILSLPPNIIIYYFMKDYHLEIHVSQWILDNGTQVVEQNSVCWRFPMTAFFSGTVQKEETSFHQRILSKN